MNAFTRAVCAVVIIHLTSRCGPIVTAADADVAARVNRHFDDQAVTDEIYRSAEYQRFISEQAVRDLRKSGVHVVMSIDRDGSSWTTVLVCEDWNGRPKELGKVKGVPQLSNISLIDVKCVKPILSHIQSAGTRSVCIRAARIDSAVFRSLADCEAVEEIWLQSPNLDLSGARYLGALWNLKKLVICHSKVDPQVISQIENRLGIKVEIIDDPGHFGVSSATAWWINGPK